MTGPGTTREMARAGTAFVEGASERIAEREQMVRTQIAARGVTQPAILDAMRAVPRHRFVAGATPIETDQNERAAYADRPLPIGCGQTISQPYVVGWMLELAGVQPGAHVLEVGTGCGYQAAVAAAAGADVYSIEIVSDLASRAARTLSSLGFGPERRGAVGALRLCHGDGYFGWPEFGPFDAIVLAAAPREIPTPLLEQLSAGGRLVAPIGDQQQELVVITRCARGFESRIEGGVRFVPMTGRAEGRVPPSEA